MAGERLDSTEARRSGLWGDRGWAVRDEVSGEILTAKRNPVLMQCAAAYREALPADCIPQVEIRLPDGSRISSDAPAAIEPLSQLLGRRVSLREGPYLD